MHSCRMRIRSDQLYSPSSDTDRWTLNAIQVTYLFASNKALEWDYYSSGWIVGGLNSLRCIKFQTSWPEIKCRDEGWMDGGT